MKDEEFLPELREQWKILWRDRIDDRVRAEGIASGDYEMLFVDRGTVIIATRDYKPPTFAEILERHKEEKQIEKMTPPDPKVGGWRKFIRDVINKQARFTGRGRLIPSEPKKRQQLKKGGRGWIHRF